MRIFVNLHAGEFRKTEGHIKADSILRLSNPPKINEGTKISSIILSLFLF